MPSQAQGLVLPSSNDRISLCRRMPLGVIGVIAPFNFPLYLAMRAVAPALAVGNAVIVKPDPRTSISGGVIIAQLLAEAGLPEGVLHVLPGAGDAGAALCSDPNVAMIAFTGSTSAGRKVGELAGRHLKKVSLELGGKNTLIVLDDADLDHGCLECGLGRVPPPGPDLHGVRPYPGAGRPHRGIHRAARREGTEAPGRRSRDKPGRDSGH